MGRQKVDTTAETDDVLRALGAQVRLARRALNWTAAELADRSGVSARTVTQLERGAPSVSIGNAVKIATTAGVPLFAADPAAARRHGEAQLALLPSRVYHPRRVDDVDLDF
jgi:transcriptional regulator with XRE-family HTH domain